MRRGLNNSSYVSFLLIGGIALVVFYGCRGGDTQKIDEHRAAIIKQVAQPAAPPAAAQFNGNDYDESVRWLAGLLDQRSAAMAIPTRNPLLRDEQRKANQPDVSWLIGKRIQWTFPIHLTSQFGNVRQYGGWVDAGAMLPTQGNKKAKNNIFGNNFDRSRVFINLNHKDGRKSPFTGQGSGRLCFYAGTDLPFEHYRKLAEDDPLTLAGNISSAQFIPATPYNGPPGFSPGSGMPQRTGYDFDCFRVNVDVEELRFNN